MSGGRDEAIQPDPACTGHPRLLAKLMAAVRPGFRADNLIFDPRDPVFGGPPCAVSGCDRPARERGMCKSHRQRWLMAGKPDLAEFASTTSPDWAGHRPLASCEVAGCRYGQISHAMCARHTDQCKRAGRPGLAGWRGSDAPLPPPPSPPPICRIGYCNLWARGTSPFCSTHDLRWKRLGRPGSVEEFAAACETPGAGEHIDLRCLPVQLRLEVQYVLQRRCEEATAKIRPRHRPADRARSGCHRGWFHAGPARTLLGAFRPPARAGKGMARVRPRRLRPRRGPGLRPRPAARPGKWR